MRNILSLATILVVVVLLGACQEKNVKENVLNLAKSSAGNYIPLVESVMTPEERSKLTPELVIETLKSGNQRFVENDLTVRDHSKQIREAVMGQFPKAVVLTCIDSRIPVEDVFDRGIGDMFVTRVSGNVVGDDIIGSIEYASKLAGAKLVMVLGHEHCQAVISAIDGVDMGNFSMVTDKIRPAIEQESDFAGDKTSMNPEFVERVTMKNIEMSVNDIRNSSSILQEMENSGEIKIVGAYYDLDKGKVIFTN